MKTKSKELKMAEYIARKYLDLRSERKGFNAQMVFQVECDKFIQKCFYEAESIEDLEKIKSDFDDYCDQ